MTAKPNLAKSATMNPVEKSKPFNIAMLGGGWIGQAHAHSFRNLQGHDLNPVCHTIATSNMESAKKSAEQLGFQNYSDDWQAVCENDEIDMVIVASPFSFHFEQIKAIIASQKHFIIEKPIVANKDELQKISKLLENYQKTVQVGFTYIHNPMLYTAKTMIDNGDLGQLHYFRIIHSEDFMAYHDSPFKKDAIHLQNGGGVVRELAPHPLAMINYLIGKPKALSANANIIYAHRIDEHGNTHAVTAPDNMDCLMQMDSGIQGTLSTSWASTGRGMNLAFEIYGSKGSICFNQERLNELEVYLPNRNKPELKGALTLRAAGAHEGFSLVNPGDEHGIGMMDMMILAGRDYLDAIVEKRKPINNIGLGLAVEQQVNAIHQSIQNKQWVDCA